MIIRKLRLQRGWSQEQLSQLSGVSVRTIQRIEKGHNAGLESLKSLAAVFEVNVEHLQKEPEMNSDSLLTLEEKQVLAQVQEIKSFYQNLLSYVCVIAML
ncbi:TPA: helix-turn-helix domain-containing protein, partial [Photobacterium damselae]